MKKLLYIVLIASSLFSKSEILSQIPPAQNIFINLSTEQCDKNCLNDLLKNGKIFSFLEIYKSHSQYDDIQNAYEKFSKIFMLEAPKGMNIKIAMLVPQRTIRRYAISTVNSVLSYLLYRKYNFELKIYNSENEDKNSLLLALKRAKKDGFRFIIAPLTDVGANIVNQNSAGFTIYIPTVNISKIQNPALNITFGGISYKEQIDKLLTYARKKIVIFSDKSSIADELNQEVRKSQKMVVYDKQLVNSNLNFKKMLKWNKKIDNSSIFMNLPLVKTSLLASQLRVYDRNPYNLLSTQINYNPMILTLTQYQDRKSFLIANSIGEVNTEILNSSELLESDIKYDWVNYSTALGVDLFYNRYFLPEVPRSFTEGVQDGQVIYKTNIIVPGRYKLETLTDEGM
jgi:SRSO17 transposase